ncbi:MAG: hypothetical protein O2782_08410 [bacterium]|nr:hypothetical protein [bacterium]
MPRPGPVTALLGRIFATDRRCLWVLAACSFVLVRFYFARGGVSWAGDGSLHLTYAALAAQSIAAGQLPIWTNYFAAGSPFLQFYGFAFYYVVGLLDLLLGNLNLSVKLVLAAGHVLSGLTMFAFLRVALRSRSAAFLGGLGFVLTFWHTQHVVIMGRLPLSLFYACLPLPFCFFERARIPRLFVPSIIKGALALAVLIFIHPGYAAWATIFLTLYMSLRLVRSHWTARAWRHAAAAGLLLLFGQIAGASLTLPMWLERGTTGLAQGISLAQVPDPSWQQLLSWSNFRLLLVPLPESSRHWYGGYLGLSLVVLAIIGLAGPLLARQRLRRGPALAMTVSLVVALVLVLGYRWQWLQLFRFVQAFNAGRYLLFVSFFLTAMAGAGALHLLGRRPRSADLWRATLMLVIVLIDLGPTTFQQPYITEQMEHPGGDPGSERALAVTDAQHLPLALTLLHWQTGMPTPQGIFDESSISYLRFCRPWLAAVTPVVQSVEHLDQLQGKPGADLVYAGLRLLHASEVYVFRDQRGQMLPVPESVSGPVVVSSQLAVYTGPDDPEIAAPVSKLATTWSLQLTEASRYALGIVSGMGLQLQSGVSERIYLGHGQARNLGTRPELRLLAHEVEAQAVRLDLQVSEACFARLAYSFHPHLQVLLDGQPTMAMETAGGYLALELPPGRHEIILQPRLSPLRRALIGVDLGLVCIAVVLLVRHRRRRQFVPDV